MTKIIILCDRCKKQKSFSFSVHENPTVINCENVSERLGFIRQGNKKYCSKCRDKIAKFEMV